jgi:hypothetical protein
VSQFNPSLMFARKAADPHQWPCRQILTRLKVEYSGKHTSLLQDWINYSCKKFHSNDFNELLMIMLWVAVPNHESDLYFSVNFKQLRIPCRKYFVRKLEKGQLHSALAKIVSTLVCCSRCKQK